MNYIKINNFIISQFFEKLGQFNLNSQSKITIN
jgi:hypothetical protein